MNPVEWTGNIQVFHHGYPRLAWCEDCRNWFVRGEHRHAEVLQFPTSNQVEQQEAA